MQGLWRLKRPILVLLGLGVFGAAPALAIDLSQGGSLVKGLLGAGSPAAMDDATVGNGLKEALRVASERAVGSSSKTDGFLGNELIRIGMPAKIAPMTKALQLAGYGGQLQAFEVGMNRAAEQASGEAKEVFFDAIGKMTLSDAQGILKGGDTAATEYFRRQTSDTLRVRFRPIVARKMEGLGLYQQYNQLTGAYTALPLASKPSLDIDDYVTEKGLEGLFTLLGQEEAAIRQNPAARSSELLQKVFGGR